LAKAERGLGENEGEHYLVDKFGDFSTSFGGKMTKKKT